MTTVATGRVARLVETGEVRTWADGFGTWHVRVPNGSRSLTTARLAILRELQQRAARCVTVPLPRVAVVKVTETHTIFREDW